MKYLATAIIAVALAACANTHMTEGQALGASEGVIDGGVLAADAVVRAGLPAAVDAKIAATETAIQKALPPLRAAYATSDSTFTSQLAAVGALVVSLYQAYGATPPQGAFTLAKGQLVH